MLFRSSPARGSAARGDCKTRAKKTRAKNKTAKHSDSMAQQITTGTRTLVETAKREIETLSIEQALSLRDREDVNFIEKRTIRKLEREECLPGAFHRPHGTLGFRIDPQSKYHKPVFAEDGKFVCFLRRRLSLGPGGADRVPLGAQARRALPWRHFRLEESGRPDCFIAARKGLPRQLTTTLLCGGSDAAKCPPAPIWRLRNDVNRSEPVERRIDQA